MRDIYCLLVCFLAISSVYTADPVITNTQNPCWSPAMNGILEIYCWGYNECVNNVTIRHVCPSGDVLEKDSLKCVVRGTSGSECDKTSTCTGLQDGMHADVPDKCTSYFRCYGAINIGQFFCPGSTVFNDAIQGCDYRSNVEPPCGTKLPSTPSVAVTPSPVVVVGRKKRSIEGKEWRKARIERRRRRNV